MSLIQDRASLLASAPDIAAPGLTRKTPVTEVTQIALNPLGEYHPPPYVDPGEFSFQELLIGATPQKIGMSAHEHVIFDNQGLFTIQFSVDNKTWVDFLPAGRVAVLDWHKGNQIYMQCPGGTAVILITTW